MPIVFSVDEYVVFVTPTKLQLSIFEKILSHDKLDSLVRNSTAESLALINILTKISNSPILLKATADQAKLKAQQGGDVVKRNALEEALQLLPERAQIDDVSLSGGVSSVCAAQWYLMQRRQGNCQPLLLCFAHCTRFVRRHLSVTMHSYQFTAAHGREMYHSFALHLHAQYHRSLL